MLTSDTFGTVSKQCERLPVHVHVLQSSSHIKEKADYLERFGNRQVVAIGNGADDQLMLEKQRWELQSLAPRVVREKRCLWEVV